MDSSRGFSSSSSDRLLYIWLLTLLCIHLATAKLEIVKLKEHPLSVLNRLRRQAYSVHDTKAEIGISIEGQHQPQSGPWGLWTQQGDCSRTCGGGVAIDVRQCQGSGCKGPSKRYTSCNSQECPPDSKDFRTEQCEVYNDQVFAGKYYTWKPSLGIGIKNKCELNCQPIGENFFMKHAPKVVDGTKCDSVSNDICVEGLCLPLGCDGKLGSAIREDKCLECGGKGTSCKTVQGFFDEKTLEANQYHDIITIPEGATTIRVEEKRATNNYLAIHNSSGHWHLNGNFQIEMSQDINLAGTIFEYERKRANGVAFERLLARGPLTEELTVALLYQADSSTGIQYEYSVPLEEVKYVYKVGAWEDCDVTCGKGNQTRTVTCTDVEENRRVDSDLCDAANATLPDAERPCETVDCDAEWFTGPWEECSMSCGDLGWQYRVVYCHQVFKDGRKITVEDEKCAGDRPDYSQTCNRFVCPSWNAGPWSACSKACGEAMQYRSVTCRSEKTGEEGMLLAAGSCPEGEGPAGDRTCNLGPCEGLNFVTTDWDLCEKCNDTTETREVFCEDEESKRYPLDKCEGEKPIDTRPCAKTIPCVYEWQTSQWSNCSTSCGHGHQTRTHKCVINDNGSMKIMDDSHCDPTLKPGLRQNCTMETTCTGKYMMDAWSECSASCAGGMQKRNIYCFTWDYKIDPMMCDELGRPTTEQACNTDPCPTCFDGEFGCCPDNSTEAIGPYLEGCSNCSISEFGCCADNYTEAAGSESEGCPEYIMEEGSGDLETNVSLNASLVSTMAPEPCNDTEHGCCEDGSTVATGPDQAGCPATLCDFIDGEDNTTVTMDCAVKNATNATYIEEPMVLGNETESNVTVPIPCSKTEFGCCPDWFTAAEGKNNEGCLEFILGECGANMTQFGCCQDDVTLARGPNLEGCGHAGCAASLYGCCKDRRTIAFGPHYLGCERSAYPCESSEFGCCPDGETAALGSKGEGCGEDCLLTKYGCCPDGMTAAEGAGNKGCGCSVAPFGCCPDGKTAANGPNFAGCPQTCTQSRHGCCPDGKTAATGRNSQGCPCQYTEFGCCPDGETAALGPSQKGCDDCIRSKYKCCLDGVTKAMGPNYEGCPGTTPSPLIVQGTVSPQRIAACSLPFSSGTVCGQYTMVWAYKEEEGRCAANWYGGCGGNENRFSSEAECKTVCINPPGEGVCYLPKMDGRMDCSNYKLSYYYNLNERRCAPFYWRGCGGNKNRFASQSECTNLCGRIQLSGGRRTAPPTRAPATTTTTRERITRPRPVVVPVRPPQLRHTPAPPVDPCRPNPCHPSQRCVPEPKQCVRAPCPQYRCSAVTPSAALGRLTEADCLSRFVVGYCQLRTQVWYFDGFTGQCHNALYSGCGGNRNRFASLDECERQCGAFGPRRISNGNVHRPQSSDACRQPKGVGHCDGRFERVYYDMATNACLAFEYSGCGGNDNRFHSLEQCQRLCLSTSAALTDKTQHTHELVDVCDQPKVVGHCPQRELKWYFNKADGTCRRFMYTGCGGNDNRFNTHIECNERCAKRAYACDLPAAKGPCQSNMPRWYFNREQNRCLEFVYGGCLGNVNRFPDARQCEAQCVASRVAHASGSVSEAVLNVAHVGAGNRHGDIRENPLNDINIDTYEDEEYEYYNEDDEWIDPNAVHPDRPISNPQQSTSQEDVCLLPQDSGPCTKSIASWYFDTLQGQCLSFNFGGCGGNRNRFQTKSDCENLCGGTKSDGGFERPKGEGQVEPTAKPVPLPATYKPPTSLLPELCKLQKEAGACFGENLRWYFNHESNACESFMFTGCDGNANRFSSEEACLRACGAFRDQDVCNLSYDQGTCDHTVNKWYFNSETGECVTFHYGGCGGNGNRFSSKEECENLCNIEARPASDVCQLEKVVGPCRAAERRWFYNTASRQCESFTYGGCRGNENNFLTKHLCQQRCTVTAAVTEDSCLLERDAGPCSDPVSQWYFDREAEACRPFTYGGCRGNANRFSSKELCELTCQGHKSAALSKPLTVAECSLHFDAGPCRAERPRFYYDATVGECREFLYGGCQGNKNRFHSLEQCQVACGHVKPTQEPLKVRIETEQETYRAGSTVTLRCSTNIPVDSGDQYLWFKDDQQLTRLGDRLQISEGMLRISEVEESDGGRYSCAPAGSRNSTRSIHVTIGVLGADERKNCTDNPHRANCPVIVRAGLCKHVYYGSDCCRSCWKAGKKP